MSPDRRQFFKLASAGALGSVVTARPGRADPKPLRRRHERRSRPQVAIRYPEEWFLYEQLVIDLYGPTELFSVSSHELEPHRSPEETGKPDFSRVPLDAALVSVLSLPVQDLARKDPGPPVSRGVDYDSFAVRDDAPLGYEYRAGWYIERGAGFLFRAWVGLAGGDRDTLKDVISSFHFVES